MLGFRLKHFNWHNSKGLYIVFISLLTLGFLFSQISQSPVYSASRPEELINKSAPLFVITSIDGEKIDLNKLNKVILIDFWATWCGPCKEITPTITALDKAYSEQGLFVLGIAVNDSLDSIKKYIKDNKVSYPIVASTSKGDTPLTKIAQDYGVRAIPTLILIDKHGTVRYTFVGVSRNQAKFQEELDILISELLKEDI